MFSRSVGSLAGAILLALTTLSACAGSGQAQSQKLADWPQLLDQKKVEEAKKLCNSFINSSKLSEQVEAQKCLANAALCGGEVLRLEGAGTTGLTLGSGYTPEAADKALTHLNIALKLAPQDLSIHQGRLHVLEASGRFSEMIEAVDKSAEIYKGSDALDAWLAYAPELDGLHQYKAALAFMQVLDKHYPGQPDVLANIGAFLDALNRGSEAIPYLERAVKLAPKDPVNAWDLAGAYNRSNRIDLADTWYKKGLSLMTDKQQIAQSNCFYAKFIDKKLHDPQRACLLEKKNCAAAERPACKAPEAR
jgi:tetratricopeptide (TPR) repeat protein